MIIPTDIIIKDGDEYLKKIIIKTYDQLSNIKNLKELNIDDFMNASYIINKVNLCDFICCIDSDDI